ncbi:hypothetical protein HYX06_03815 [Candidatus Woesearchaeota archaeon]|nr:hypothetical protein [Candidatus Woesearchaeota archaeon]
MNKVLLFSIVVLGIFIVSGCAKQVVDCGTDVTCFYKNFRTCTPSKVGGGAMEIKGGSVKSCNIHAETDNPSFQNGEIKHEILTMKCTIRDTDTFKDIEINGLGLISKGSCSGSMYDVMTQIIRSAEDIQNR